MWRPSKVAVSELSEQFKLQPPSILQGSVNALQVHHCELYKLRTFTVLYFLSPFSVVGQQRQYACR